MVFAIKNKILSNNAYGLLNHLEFICNHFNSLFKAESEFKNSKFGGKSSQLLIQCWFPNKFDFSVIAHLLPQRPKSTFKKIFPLHSPGLLENISKNC